MKYISLDTLLTKYIEDSTINFCTDDSAYGFVLGLTTHTNDNIIIKLNLNYFSPYGKSGESSIRKQSRKRGNKKNQNIDDLRREVSNQIEFANLSTAIPHIKDSAILQREDAIKFSKALEDLNSNCDALPYWTAHLISQLTHLNETQDYKFETKTGIIIMDSVGDLTLDDIVKEDYSLAQKISLSKYTKKSYSISETFKGKARALLLSLLWCGILHGDPHMENIRVDSETGKLYLIDFGASIDFGSGSRHLPKYLRNNEKTKKMFSEVKNDVNNWLQLTKHLTEEGFKTQYRTLLDKVKPNDTISIMLLEHTILKADPRQNGKLLTWNDINTDDKWSLYRSGYEWIVNVDNDGRWKTMIEHAIIGNDVSSISSSHKSNRTRKKSSLNIPKPHSANSSTRKMTTFKPLASSRSVKHKKKTHSRRHTRRNFKDSLMEFTTPQLRSAALDVGVPVSRRDSRETTLDKILVRESTHPNTLSRIVESVNS